YSLPIKRLPIIFFFFLGVLCVLAVYKIGIRHSGKGFKHNHLKNIKNNPTPNFCQCTGMGIRFYV
ncbi:MAG: hypothetical protein WBB28_28715, partial [Crinalium sp.]